MPLAQRIVCVSQARMTSTRLPGKVLMPAAGRPLIRYHLERLMRAKRLDGLVLATTTNATDDPLAEAAVQLGVPVFRGDEHDVLGRFAGAAAAARADIVVRVTGDCPLIDPALVDELIGCFVQGEPLDYLSIDPTRYPRGLDAEIFTRAALDAADAEATEAAEREHVTPFIYRHPERFRLGTPLAPKRTVPPHRWCVDELSDLELVSRILTALGPRALTAGWQDVCKVLDLNPGWTLINRDIQQRLVH